MLGTGLVRISIEKLSVQAFVGVYELEQQSPRTICIDLEFEYDRPATDSLDKAIDYACIRDKIFSAVENRRFGLVETVAQTILTTIKEPRMIWLSVRVRKPRALKQAESVAALVEWRRQAADNGGPGE
jgi:dihydroneopterin aldolase